MPKLSVCIITCNEASNIRDCLASVAWADEIVVVDGGSTDETVRICREFTDRVFELDWPGHVAQKNRAVDRAANDWVLSIDADERVSTRLRAEIEAVMRGEPAHAGYTMPRLTWYCGRWMRHGTWYPDRKLRLFSRAAGRFSGLDPHDRVEVRGSVGRLASDLLHYSYRDVAHHLEVTNRYTTIMAGLKAEAGVCCPLLRMIAHPPFTFLKGYVLRLGFLDGTPGLVAAVLGSVYEFLKYAKVWEAQRAAGGAARRPAESRNSSEGQ
jgi:glycosyltransferase involved in cell wall biosynthesis